MKWVEARITFESRDPAMASDLISEIFYDFGLQGVIVESPGTESGIDWAENDITVHTEHAVIGYFPKNGQLAERCRMLEEKLNLLHQSFQITTQLAYHDIDEQDWAHSWKQYFFTEKITDTIVIKPSWRTYQAGPEEIVLEIDPGMAFGTGTHPTTRMCIALIEKYIRPKDTFLDIGTGSGILMIAAAKLGAAATTGIDNDEMAVSVARQNLARNYIPKGKYEIKTGNLTHDLNSRYSLVAANILSEIIVQLADDVQNVMLPGAFFICSGIIESKQKMVADKLTSVGFYILETRIEEEWVAMVGRLARN